ncbi:MAG TPA: hypothetical protein DDZ68_00615 [Parvularcula sp.]|nr:hypothetical protein [Parvularcula sp.]
MRVRARISPPVRLLAAALLAVGGLGLASALNSAPRKAAPAVEGGYISPAAARALGARWRDARRPDLEREYAQALLAAGLSGDLLTAVAADGLFANDPAARALFRAEALLRLYRYKDAAAEASAPALADNPYAAFIRVRARAGAGGGLDRDALTLATRGPAALAREAWLLRARAALDESDFATADASLKRAAEAGATKARTEPFRIERDIRAGKTAAAAALGARAQSLAKMASRRGETPPDIEGMRLAAMLALRAGDGREAARLADRAQLGTPGDRDAPLAAFAKWMAGDRAQAEAVLAAHLRAAPGDFVARDLAAALAFEQGEDKAGEAHLAALEISNRPLAAFRRMRRAAARGDFDGALRAARGFSAERRFQGAAAALLGAGAATARLPEPSDADRALAALAGAADQRSARAAASALLGARRSPVDLAAAAETFAQLGLDEDAAALAVDASRAAAGFYAPVALRAALLERQGRTAEALGHLEIFAARNAGHAPVRIARARLLLRLDEIDAAATAFAAIDPAALFADEGAALDYARAAALAGEPSRWAMTAAAKAALAPGETLGRVLEAAGDDAAAAETYRDALIDHPDSADLQRAYREVMIRQGRLDDAEALFALIARRRAGPEAGEAGGA